MLQSVTSVGNARTVSQAANIAIVDDDPDIREAVHGMVESIGHSAVLFASAEEFLAFPARVEIDCMILDVRMPGMSGLELQARLRNEPDCPMIIFMTSDSDDVTRQRALQGGATCFLGKPVSDDILIECLEVALLDRCRRPR